MSDEKESVVFKLDLDSKNFLEGLAHAKGALGEMSEVESLESLLGVMKNIGLAAGIIAVAFYGLKGALDLTMEAESIKRTEEQFKMLTEQSGIATEKLKKGLEDASHGLVNMDEALAASNKAIIAMGSSAERLPEVMELATKATRVFGGEVISNFEQISQALATGRTRSLKQFGITVDDVKAVKDFAASHGIAANALSESGRRQAIMNEALKQAKIRFKEIKADGEELTTTWTKFKVALKETYETFAMFFDKYFGDIIRKSVKAVANAISELSTAARAAMGDSTAKHSIEMKQYETKKKTLIELAETEKNLQKQHWDYVQNGQTMLAENTQQMLNRIYKQKSALVESIAEVDKKLKEAKTEKKPQEQKSNESLRDEATAAKDKALFERDLLSMREERLKMQIESNTSYEQADILFKEKMKLLEEDQANKISEINQKSYLDDNQKKEEALQSDLNFYQQKKMMEEERVRIKEDADKRMMESDKNAMNSFMAGARVAGNSVSKDMKNAGRIGEYATRSFVNNASKAMQDWVTGSATASEAVKGFALGTMADVAEMEGKTMMLHSFSPLTGGGPAEFAGGLGLVALAGVMRGLAGGRSSMGGGGGESGGGASLGASSDMTGTLQQEQQTKKSVHIEIHGNYMETDQTRRQLMEMIRQETDATDFVYKQVPA